MSSRVLRRTALVAAAASTTALVLAGCAGSGGDASGGSDEDITLTITTFGTFGYDDLYAEYEEAHPNITIEATNIDTGGNARTDAFTKIAAGSGLSDIVAIEEGWLGSIMEVSDQFVDLRDFDMEDRQGDWLDWKVEQVTDQEGRIIGYGTDIGPAGLCYNAPAFQAAGLPTDRAAVAELFGGDDATWERFFELGRQYKQATGKAWYDHNGFVWNSMVNQLEEGYYTKDGELNVEDNAELQERFGWIADASADGLSAAQTAWDWNGGKAFTDQTFATFVCPGWMLGVVQGQLEAGGGGPQTGWDFADVFPGGGGNWGGSFLVVPQQSEHPEEAQEFAAWITAPEQQAKAFAAIGAFPSQVEALEAPEVLEATNPFFNDAPVGKILSNRAEAITVQPYKGPKYSDILQAFQAALLRVDDGSNSPVQSWKTFLSDVAALS